MSEKKTPAQDQEINQEVNLTDRNVEEGEEVLPELIGTLPSDSFSRFIIQRECLKTVRNKTRGTILSK